MWITQFFLLIFLVIDTFHALPTKNLADSPNVVVSINAHENATGEHGRSSDIRHPIVQSKPRILVSYGNVYKQTPVDPMQNLLMYFLMNVARDFAQDQDQFDRRRSPGFFSDAKSSLTDVTGKIVNGSKKIGQKIGDSIRSISSREIPVESQYEEAHYYPHIDGTCMCFNRLVRQRPQTDTKSEEMKRNPPNEGVKASLEISTEKKSKDEVTAVHLKDEKTTELKTENHNVPVSNENSTIIAVENGQMLKENNNVVRVLKVLDLDNLKTNKASIDTTTAPKQQIIKDVIDLKTIAQENLNKRNFAIETFRPPLQPASLELPKKEILGDNKNKSSDDDGYYFLLSSGGTEKRTTASDVNNRELKNNENLLPKHEDETEHLMEMKRKKRKRAKRHMATHDRRHKTKIDILREKFRRRAKRHERRGKKQLKHDETDKFVPGSPKLINSDISVLMLPNVFKSEKHQLRNSEILEPPSRQKLLLTVTLPTVIGGGLVLLGLCYFLRAKGWCCQLFMDKSHIVVVAVNENTRKESIAIAN